MRNPAAIPQPKLSPPYYRSTGEGIELGNLHLPHAVHIAMKKRGKNKGNLPYLRFRRRLRRDMFR